MRSEKIKTFSHKDEKILELLREIINIFEKNIKIPFKLYLFGSFAIGKATYFSDIDIALETKEDLNEKEILRLKEKLENIRTLRKIDFVYLNKASKSIKNTIKNEGVSIYEFK